MPFFTVIIPSYNRWSTLQEAIRSVQLQSFKDFECWIVDDASTDGTWESLQALQLGPPFKLLRNERNRRQHYSRNRVIAQTSSDWVTFLDSDDVWLPRRLEVFAEAIQRTPTTGFWFSNGYWMENGRVVGAFLKPGQVVPEGIVPGHYAIGNRWLPYVTTNVAVRRESFERLGTFREDMQILEDTEFYTRLLAARTPVGCIREPLSLYRMHTSQITRNYGLQLKESLMALDVSGSATSEKRALSKHLLIRTIVLLFKANEIDSVRAVLREHRDLRTAWLLPFTWLPLAWLEKLKTVRRSWNKRFPAASVAPQAARVEMWYGNAIAKNV